MGTVTPPVIPIKPAREIHKEVVRLRVNGELREIYVPVNRTLLEVLREDLNLTGTKHGCELGECGACTVLVDGEPNLSCLTLPIDVSDREVTTIEGMARRGAPHPLQTAFAELGASQCGYCSPGVLMSAYALLSHNARPSRQQIRQALSGNLCRCTGYNKILDAVARAAEYLTADDDNPSPLPGRTENPPTLARPRGHHE